MAKGKEEENATCGTREKMVHVKREGECYMWDKRNNDTCGSR